jgi:ferredoxin-NADP reductase
VAYSSALRRREEVAQGTMAFYFDKPAGFDFKPGQFVDVVLPDPPQTDAEGNGRALSLASAPADPHLMVATRLRDTAFKRVLRALPLGSPVQLDGPSGSFTLHKNPAKPAVFVAGGIGITPFRSILHQAARDRLAHQLYLFFSNRRPEDAPFLEDLQDLARQSPNFHFLPTMTEMEKSQREWKGERGFLDRAMLTRHLPALHGSIYYLAGPPGMVTALRQTLIQAGADEDDIRTEEFSGY